MNWNIIYKIPFGNNVLSDFHSGVTEPLIKIRPGTAE